MPKDHLIKHEQDTGEQESTQDSYLTRALHHSAQFLLSFKEPMSHPRSWLEIVVSSQDVQ